MKYDWEGRYGMNHSYFVFDENLPGKGFLKLD